MNILYHLTVPPSAHAECDAVVQEVRALQSRFGGSIDHLYPGRRPGARFPRRFWGVMRWPLLRWAERRAVIHHIYNPDPYPFAILRWLQRPVIYTISAGIQARDEANARELARRVQTLVVATERERERLHDWGIENVLIVCPGIDLARFSPAPPPADLPPTLLMGSAPWTREQFRTKGVEALLALAQRWPELHLVFLWRGILYEEMMRRVHASGLSDRVEVINERVDVAAVLARVHAAVILATGDALIKAYPHSLLEAMAAGRPVIVSWRVSIARDVQAAKCGIALEDVEVASLVRALRVLLANYAAYARRAADLSAAFSQQRLLTEYAAIYRAAQGDTEGDANGQTL
jgi:glycosyltransferase involved in cell wall biosynthesis